MEDAQGALTFAVAGFLAIAFMVGVAVRVARGDRRDRERDEKQPDRRH